MESTKTSADDTKKVAPARETAADRGHPNAAREPDIAGAARTLANRVRAARDAGFVVQLGFPVEALDTIVVSATDKALGQQVTERPIIPAPTP